jgi:membrane associated rhomboid family serine protease
VTPGVPVRIARRLREAEAWALVLSSQAIPSQLVRRGEGVIVTVAQEDGERALHVLDLYDRENANRGGPRVRFPDYGSTQIGIALAIGLVGLFVLTGTPEGRSVWFERGTAAADRILAGEIWRTATALTLHSDVPHVLGNAVGFALFGTAVFRIFGPGVGALLVLIAGVAGNFANALVHGGQHNSIGFSTAVFAAIGILSGVQFGRARQQGLARAWLPLAAALGLLAMLGMGERTDLSAHLLGLLTGIVVGALAQLAISRPPAAAVQLSCGTAAAAALVSSWWLAFR